MVVKKKQKAKKSKKAKSFINLKEMNKKLVYIFESKKKAQQSDASKKLFEY